MLDVTDASWLRAQEALREEVARVTTLLRSIGRSEAPAVGRWDLGDVAMHLSQAWIVVPALARSDPSAISAVVPAAGEMPGESPLDDIWDLGHATSAGVIADTERDLGVLADRIESRAEEYLTGCAGMSSQESRPWLVEGVRLPLPVFTGHLLNETIVHGYDMARAARRRWAVYRAHAAMVVEDFLFPVIQALDPRAMVDQERAKGLRVSYELRIRGGGRHLFAFNDGALTLSRPGSTRVDCHLSADPAALLLVAWGRKSQWGAIARGQLTAWGRKPWLGPRLRLLMRNP